MFPLNFGGFDLGILNDMVCCIFCPKYLKKKLYFIENSCDEFTNENSKGSLLGISCRSKDTDIVRI